MTSIDPTHLPFLSNPLKPSRTARRGQALHPTPSLPVPAFPDFRYEQSYLLSITPFISVHSNSSSKEKQNLTSHQDGKPIGSQKPNVFKEMMELDDDGRERQVKIRWGELLYITLRDQVRNLHSIRS
jgi:hypothetical protein